MVNLSYDLYFKYVIFLKKFKIKKLLYTIT